MNFNRDTSLNFDTILYFFSIYIQEKKIELKNEKKRKKKKEEENESQQYLHSQSSVFHIQTLSYFQPSSISHSFFFIKQKTAIIQFFNSTSVQLHRGVAVNFLCRHVWRKSVKEIKRSLRFNVSQTTRPISRSRTHYIRVRS